MMTISLNSVGSFNPTAISTKRAFPARKNGFTHHHTAEMKSSRFHLYVANGENATTEATDKNPNEETASTNTSVTKSSESAEKPSPNLKKAPLTARERLRAARVLSRYNTEPKPVTSKPELNSKLVDALKESDKGKRRPGLPEAPTNLFDDSKRGMPKQGWTIDLPGGMDVFSIVFSFVFISTVMFATTYLVWKVGAIHFNES